MARTQREEQPNRTASQQRLMLCEARQLLPTTLWCCCSCCRCCRPPFLRKSPRPPPTLRSFSSPRLPVCQATTSSSHQQADGRRGTRLALPTLIACSPTTLHPPPTLPSVARNAPTDRPTKRRTSNPTLSGHPFIHSVARCSVRSFVGQTEEPPKHSSDRPPVPTPSTLSSGAANTEEDERTSACWWR